MLDCVRTIWRTSAASTAVALSAKGPAVRAWQAGLVRQAGTLHSRLQGAQRRFESASGKRRDGGRPHVDDGPSQDADVVAGVHYHVQAAVITAKRPHRTSLAELLSHVAPVSPSTQSRMLHPLLLVLVTPAFSSQLLYDGEELVGRTLERTHKALFEHLQEHTLGIDSLIAVVDRLPSPSVLETGHSTVSSSNARSLHPPVLDIGHEGLAYCFIDRSEDPIAVSLGVVKHATDNHEVLRPADRREQGTLSLILSNELDASSLSDIDGCSVEVHSPLARTTFTNGLPFTLLHYQYQMCIPTGPGKVTPTVKVKESKQELTSASVRLLLPKIKQNIALAAPLVPLTPVRTVRAVMGNIIRQLSVSEHGAEGHAPSARARLPTGPASQELEAAVSAYFKARAIPSQPVQVWALVSPQPHERVGDLNVGSDPLETLRRLSPADLSNAWRSHQDGTVIEEVGSLFAALQRGARLCKVLSGGGGWGKKAGLLSLDPDANYTSSDIGNVYQLESLFGVHFQNENEPPQALKNVAEVGDTIQFFLCPDLDSNSAMMMQGGTA
ncbi:hypothetical protein LTR66_017855, partial [Elasticomyces elasticus]